MRGIVEKTFSLFSKNKTLMTCVILYSILSTLIVGGYGFFLLTNKGSPELGIGDGSLYFLSFALRFSLIALVVFMFIGYEFFTRAKGMHRWNGSRRPKTGYGSYI